MSACLYEHAVALNYLLKVIQKYRKNFVFVVLVNDNIFLWKERVNLVLRTVT